MSKLINGIHHVSLDATSKEFPLTCAFCKGPLGEEIEFFKER